MLTGPGALDWFQSEAVGALDGRTHVLEAIVEGDQEIVSSNLIPFVTPSDMQLGKASVAVSAARAEDGTFIARLTTETVAMYVTLTTLAHGRFEDNAFLLRPPGRQVKFLLFEPSPHDSRDAAFQKFQASLRVEDVSLYSHPGPMVSFV